MANQHIIGEQRFEIQLSSKGGVHELQHRLSNHYWEEILPALEALFDKLVGPHELVRIPRIEIDAGTVSPEELLSDDFIQNITQQIEASIMRQLRFKEHGVERQPISMGHFERWLYFLEKGHLRYETASSISQAAWHQGIFETLAVNQLAIRRLGVLIESDPKVLARLIYQHDDQFLAQLIGVYTGFKQQSLATALSYTVEQLRKVIEAIATSGILSGDVAHEQELSKEIEGILARHVTNGKQSGGLKKAAETLLQWINGHRQEVVSYSSVRWSVLIRTQLWQQILQQVVISLRKLESPALIQEALSKSGLAPWAPFLMLDKSREHPDLLAKSLKEIAVMPAEKSSDVADPILLEADDLPAIGTSSESPDEFYIAHAGIVLLHPFYPMLFEKQGLLREEKSFKDNDHLWQGLALLHFIATGSIGAPEYDIVLSKLMCGMPLNLPTPFGIPITAEAQGEAEAMIQAAISHWDALGSVSPDGLREGFLQRPGKLSRRDSGWVLQVESKTIDIMLDRLPWNLSHLKLPWMDDFLKVEWR